MNNIENLSEMNDTAERLRKRILETRINLVHAEQEMHIAQCRRNSINGEFELLRDALKCVEERQQKTADILREFSSQSRPPLE